MIGSISQKVDSVFTGDLIEKYFDLCYVFDKNSGFIRTEIVRADCPVWVLVEILAFKDFLRFAKFYSDRYPERLRANYKLLNVVRNLRNACAHNNCILASLRTGTARPPAVVSQRVAKIPTIGTEERKNKLSSRPLFEIACLLMEYDRWVSEPLRTKRMETLQAFAHGRLVRQMEFFSGNQVVATSIVFLQKIIDNFA